MTKIFMADDDEDDTMIFKEAMKLVLDDYEIVCAANGQELLQNLRDRVPPAPDFLFLDLNMPIKSGHECLAEIRNFPFHKDIRVVILTTSRNARDIDKTYRLGADYYICKPTSIEGYRRAFEKLFRFKFRERPSKDEFVIN